MRKLHSLRQAFQEAAQRMRAHFDEKERQQTAQINDMARRLSVAAAAVTHARAAVEAKVATQTAAVESEYRRQNDMLRAQLAEVETEGRNAAHEAEAQAGVAAQATQDLRAQQHRMAEMQDALTTELRKMRDRDEQQLAELAKHEQAGVASDAQLKAMVQQLDDQTAALREAKSEIARLTNGNTEIISSHAEAKERHEETKQQLAALESEHKELKDEHELARQQLDEEKAKVAERDDQISVTVAQLSAAAVGRSAASVESSKGVGGGEDLALLVARIEQVLKSAEQLHHEARALATGRKESYSTGDGHDEEALRKDETHSLLDANARVALQVRGVTWWVD